MSQNVKYKLEQTNWLKDLEIQTENIFIPVVKKRISDYRSIKGILQETRWIYEYFKKPKSFKQNALLRIDMYY